MKFSAILALVASTQAVNLKTKSAMKTHGDGDISVTVDGAALGEIMGKLEEISNSLGMMMSNPIFEQATGPIAGELEGAAGQIMADPTL